MEGGTPRVGWAREGGEGGGQGPADLLLVVVNRQPQPRQVGDSLLESLAQGLSLWLHLTVLAQVVEHSSNFALVPAHAQQLKAIVLAQRL